MIVRLPRASARACKPSGRSAYRMVIMPAPVRMPPAPASLPQMNTEGDDIITDDHIMRGETAAGPPAGAGGLALTAAFPPVGAWPLAPVGPALLVLALQGRSLRASFVAGLLFGLALFVPLISWLINLAWYAWAALAIAEAVIFALLAVGQRVLLSLRAWPVAVAGWWVAAEALRDRWPYAFPWGRLAMSQAGTPTAPWTAIGGAPLLSFLLALAGSTLAWLLLAPGQAGWLRRRLVPA